MTTKEEMRSRIYPDEKKEDDRAVSPYIYYVLRPFSIGPTLLLNRMGMTATACTAISAVFLFAGALLILLGGGSDNYWLYLVLGSVLINIYLYLDVLDGNLARVNNSDSKVGCFLDETLNALAGVIVPIALGIGLYLAGGDIFSIFYEFSPVLFIIFGFCIGLFRLLRRVMANHVLTLVGSEGDRSNVLGQARNGPKYWASIINSIAFPSLLITSLVMLPSLWLIFYFIFNLAVVSYTIFWGYRRLQIIEKDKG